MVTLVLCGVLAMAVVAIAGGFVYSRFEGGRASILAFTLGGLGLVVGFVVVLTMGQPG